MTHVVLSLAGSSVGILVAVAVFLLFLWIRRHAADFVSYAGNGLALLSGLFCLIFFTVAPLLLLPPLLCAAIVWCQSRQPSRFPLSWTPLLGITVMEIFVAMIAAWQMSTLLVTFAGEIAHLPLTAQSALLQNAGLALALTLLLLETVGPPRAPRMLHTVTPKEIDTAAANIA